MAREWGYRWKDGDVEAVLFEEGRPDGWEDTPAKCHPPKRGRPRKVSDNGDS